MCPTCTAHERLQKAVCSGLHASGKNVIHWVKLGRTYCFHGRQEQSPVVLGSSSLSQDREMGDRVNCPGQFFPVSGYFIVSHSTITPRTLSKKERGEKYGGRRLSRDQPTSGFTEIVAHRSFPHIQPP